MIRLTLAVAIVCPPKTSSAYESRAMPLPKSMKPVIGFSSILAARLCAAPLMSAALSFLDIPGFIILLVGFSFLPFDVAAAAAAAAIAA